MFGVLIWFVALIACLHVCWLEMCCVFGILITCLLLFGLIVGFLLAWVVFTICVCFLLGCFVADVYDYLVLFVRLPRLFGCVWFTLGLCLLCFVVCVDGLLLVLWGVALILVVLIVLFVIVSLVCLLGFGLCFAVLWFDLCLLVLLAPLLCFVGLWVLLVLVCCCFGVVDYLVYLFSCWVCY